MESYITVLGASGLVGSAIAKALIMDKSHNNIIITYNTRTPIINNKGNTIAIKLDATRQSKVEKFFGQYNQDKVYLAAARVGGILANSTYTAQFIYDNLAIALHVINAAYTYNVKKLLNLGSSCIYPKYASQPMKEEYLLTSVLEQTNEPYAIAKIAAIKLCRYYNQQYGTNFISIMPTNLYGGYDNYNLETSHVLPAFIRKFHLAKLLLQNDYDAIVKDLTVHAIGFGLQLSLNPSHKEIQAILQQLGIEKGTITVWGTGEVYREFLHVDDLAHAAIFIMDNIDAKDIAKYCPDYFVNVGTGEDIKLKDLAQLVANIVGYEGNIVWDATKPDGTPKKLLDVSKIHSLGWKASIELQEGIRKVYNEYCNMFR
ncbi:MAG: GDP-L-fucose synthase family protein [Spirochaetota bacterium]